MSGSGKALGIPEKSLHLIFLDSPVSRHLVGIERLLQKRGCSSHPMPRILQRLRD